MTYFLFTTVDVDGVKLELGCPEESGPHTYVDEDYFPHMGVIAWLTPGRLHTSVTVAHKIFKTLIGKDEKEALIAAERIFAAAGRWLKHPVDIKRELRVTDD